MKALKHENILQIYDNKMEVYNNEKTNKTIYILAILMEYAAWQIEGIECHTLNDILKIYENSNKKFSLNDIMKIMEDISKGLLYAHNHNIFNKDIKDHNCFTC